MKLQIETNDVLCLRNPDLSSLTDFGKTKVEAEIIAFWNDLVFSSFKKV